MKVKNVLTYGMPSGTIQLCPSKKEIIDVSPDIIMNMKARLNPDQTKKENKMKDKIFYDLVSKTSKPLNFDQVKSYSARDS